MGNPFGKPLTVTLYLLGEDGEILEPDDAAPDIYLYNTPPTREQAETGTGAMAGYHVTTWSGTGDYRTITFDPIDDPNPTSPRSEFTYYLAANFHLEDTAERQLLIKELILRRVTGQYEALELTQTDLEAIDPSVSYIFGSGSTSITAINATVVRLLKSKFAARKIRWEQIENPAELKDSATFLGLHFAFLSQVRATGDGADIKQKLYHDHYKAQIEATILQYDPEAGDDTGGEDIDVGGVNRAWEFDR